MPPSPSSAPRCCRVGVAAVVLLRHLGRPPCSPVARARAPAPARAQPPVSRRLWRGRRGVAADRAWLRRGGRSGLRGGWRRLAAGAGVTFAAVRALPRRRRRHGTSPPARGALSGLARRGSPQSRSRPDEARPPTAPNRRVAGRLRRRRVVCASHGGADAVRDRHRLRGRGDSAERGAPPSAGTTACWTLSGSWLSLRCDRANADRWGGGRTACCRCAEIGL